MKNWYAIKAKADDTAEITIFDEIGIWGVTAKSFIADLKAISAKTITLSVNSPGGSVFDGFAIYNALKNARENGVTINAKIMGIAASAASFIVMAANSIEMPENSMMMVHYASGLAWGNSEDLRDTADILDKIDASLVGIYTARTGKSEEDVRALLQAETYLTAQEAKDAGFADTVTPNVKASATFEIDRLPANVQALFKAAQEPVNTDPAPIADPVPVADPAPSALATQIKALAASAGLEEFAPVFAMAASSIEQATASIALAGEIKALCEVASLPQEAAGFIRAQKPLADVRAALAEELATLDENTHTSNARSTRSADPTPAPKAGISPLAYWAEQRAAQKA